MKYVWHALAVSQDGMAWLKLNICSFGGEIDYYGHVVSSIFVKKAAHAMTAVHA